LTVRFRFEACFQVVSLIGRGEQFRFLLISSKRTAFFALGRGIMSDIAEKLTLSERPTTVATVGGGGSPAQCSG
jgi:hypothetical protein